MRVQDLSVEELADLLRRAQDAHGEYERQTGERDEDWPSWYAQWMLDELSKRAT